MARSSRRIPSGKEFLAWPPVLFTLFLVALLLSVSAFRISKRTHAIESETKSVEERIKKLQAENAALAESAESANSPETVERRAKEKLNLKRPGEEVVVVTPAGSTASSSEGDENFFSRFFSGWLGEVARFLAR